MAIEYWQTCALGLATFLISGALAIKERREGTRTGNGFFYSRLLDLRARC